MVDKLLKVGVDLLAGFRSPHKLVCWIEDEGQLVHLCLVECMGHRVNVCSIDPDMAGDAAKPLPSVFSTHILALCERL